MRRLWAHIIIAFTALFIMGASFSAIFTNISSNAEYKQGNEMVFKLTDKEEKESPVKEGASKRIATTMAERLELYGITAYSISTSGDDMIKVSFSESNETQKNYIINYLSFNGILGLSNKDDLGAEENFYYHITEDEFLVEGKQAYLDSINSYPTVVIPVNTDSDEFKLLLENTKKQKEAGIGETTQTGETDEDGNPITQTTTYLYLWYDFNEETDRFSRTQPDSEDYDEKIAKKIIMTFNIESPYFPDDKEDKLAASIQIGSGEGETVTVTQVRDAYDKARYYVNLLNASELECDVTYINDAKAIYTQPWSELIVRNGDPHQSLTWSRTLIATICAIVVLSLLLIAFFRLSALSIGVCSLASVFTAIGFLVTIGAEFNIGALIAIILVAVASLTSGVIYACKLKDEAYKGRSLKKANTEAGKKALLPTLDINVAVIVIGAFMYVFGGTMLNSFALVAVLGGLFSFLINAIGLRAMMWLATNTTNLTGKYNVFGIDTSRVPSIVNEEKQTFYGSFADKDFTKKKKPVGIAMCVAFALCLAAMITSAALYKGDVYTVKNNPQVSEIVFTTTNKESFLTTNDYVQKEIYEKVYVYENNTTCKTLNEYISDTQTFVHVEEIDNVEVETTYFIATLNTKFADNIDAFYSDASTGVKPLSQILEDCVGTDDKATSEMKIVEVAQTSKVSNGGVILGCGVAILVLGLYFMLRYRLSRGIASIIVPTLVGTISAGLFSIISLAQASLSPYLILALPLVVGLSIFISIIFMNKERELVIEDKTREKSVEHREEIMKRATAIAFTPMIIATILVGYLMIDFFGFGPTSTSLPFVVGLVGALLSALVVSSLFGPIAQFFYEKFSKVNINIKPRKKANKVVSKSGEPEEAIFIGIND